MAGAELVHRGEGLRGHRDAVRQVAEGRVRADGPGGEGGGHGASYAEGHGVGSGRLRY